MRLFPALLLAACFSLPVMADSLEAEPASALQYAVCLSSLELHSCTR